MVASSHPPLTDVITKRPCELLHMDLVGPARVRSAGGKWYVLDVVDDYSRYAWVFFLEEKGETLGFVRDLVLRLRNERHGDAYEQFAVTMAQNSKSLSSKPVFITLVLNTSFRVRIRLLRMAWWNGKTGPCARWLGRCSTSIGLLEVSGLGRSIPRAACRTGSTSGFTRKEPAMSWCTVTHPMWVNSMSLFVSALS
jgi:hypothetical protein